MCGIAGTYKDNASVEKMIHAIKHRGPDSQGIVKCKGDAVQGHARLALLDLSPASNQPFILKSGEVLSFNGEIWNHSNLRKQLIKEGEEFNTTGDVEVLAKALRRWGIHRALKMLDGMFAFVWSTPSGKHYLVRDQFGEVPIYFVKNKTGGFIWASERKAFLTLKINRMIPKALPPGSFLDLVSGKLHKWYEIPDTRIEAEPASVLLSKLKTGIQHRLTADAPICVLISGGIDSSLILSIATRMKKDIVAFTATFDEKSRDLFYARKLCKELKVELIEVPIVVDEKSIENAISAIEIGSKAQIEIAILCLPLADEMKRRGYKAVLSGEAADELFGGYGNFCIKASMVKTDAGIIQLRKQQLLKMSRGNFVRCNKIFLSRGVEIRLPFMHRPFVEQVVRLNLKDSPPGKKLLKQMAKNVVPDEIIKRSKETFQQGSGVSQFIAKELITNPTKFYNAHLKKRFQYLPKD